MSEAYPALDAGTRLLTPRDIRLLAAYRGITPTKKRGQNFLLDANTVRVIVERSGVREGDVVLEVGPGLGSLTLGLLDAGASVGAVELDSALAEILPGTVEAKGFESARFALVEGDALALTQLPVPAAAGHEPTRLVANLPYNVATPILLTVFERFDSVREALVMVQLEVAERIAARPGSKVYGAPSVKAAWYGTSELAGRISRRVFWPEPNVDSALVRVRRDRVQAEGEAPREEIFKVIDQAFLQRRKTLRAALKSWAGGGERASAILECAGIDPQRRGETLEIAEFIAIANAASDTPR
ncbi:16S rRNA (adenine(1518)-N(6)/adenine(1519)-N(6))-dimethyltransferase RsmA [Dermabacter sp. p3-SID358]|uniref:16S rRNA (adenine(1518)-N(6)/adenine(1519)-N(6))- dimethyltransferase RsmA n=1 Tax=Dermabacter sp. p3-SID358 TaxID=2916114 RepID=UPI0021A6E6A0|nr:16S rRNA (adenine(1518)-N(6)/adenine(1519)-N(6))-dimethyltransferase RsmA [Dermabacter sp. p3-SID358]MCT1867527.1 16S rRNA (adenine(1518)-N(6)/adenine(1519)-N(6))-dimethyltransferase RsmA [Dermabacter sp. p3-SID358]